MSIVLRPHQIRAAEEIEMAWHQGHKNVLDVLPTGAGKCLGKDTPVLMYDGTIKKVQDIVPGDLLMGIDSTPRTVLSTCTGYEDLYRVIPTKGESYVVNESHILSLKQTGLKSQPMYDSQRGKGNIVNICVKEYLNKSKTFKHTHKGWRTGVDFPTSQLHEMIDPYFLGLWLGDGSKDKPTITSADIEIENYINDYALSKDHTVRKEYQENNKSYNYHIGYHVHKQNLIKDGLKKLGVISNKHIPHSYLTGDRQQRLQLLAGIVDSDGYYDVKTISIVFKLERLANDTAYLARSLGLAAYVSKVKKTCTNTGVTGDYFSISISGDFTDIPCILKRHCFQPRKQKKSVLVTGITLEKIGYGQYFGFEISGDRMFLLGDFTVTHNTILKAEMARRELLKGGMVVIFAHRDVLLEQISKALCLMSLPHTTIVSQTTKRNIGDMHVQEFGKCYLDDRARIIVASVDKFYRSDLTYLAPLITLWMLDEAHHLLDDSKWHKCIDPLINARGLGVTATPKRADKKGLGREFSGLFDYLVVSATMEDLIAQGMLSPYKVFTPPSRIDLSSVNVTSSGDYNNKKLAQATDNSDITGDAIKEYLRLGNGKQAICFCVNILHSEHVAEQFKKAGIKAVAVSSETPSGERNRLINQFKQGLINVLVNCDLFGEGFDVPAVEVVIMLRKTLSYSLYKQQFGRALRVFNGKEYGILIDHVGNVEYHTGDNNLLYPHEDPEWSLAPPDKKKSRQNGELVDKPRSKVCPKCFARYVPTSANNFACTHCGHMMTKQEETDELKKFMGNDVGLVELKIDVIERLLKEREKVDEHPDALAHRMAYAPAVVRNSAVKNHRNRQNAQTILRDAMQKWCERYWRVTNHDIEIVKLEFQNRFGINILEAQILGAKEAEELTNKVRAS